MAREDSSDEVWKAPALKKYGEVRPDLSVKAPKQRIDEVRHVCRKECLYGARGEAIFEVNW